MSDKKLESEQQKWTPGPWLIKFCDVGDEEVFIAPIEIRSGQNNFPIVDTEGGLASAGNSWRIEEIEANAHLISAAPELYQALQKMLETARGLLRGECYDRSGEKFLAQFSEAEAALAKARGEKR